MAGRQREEGTTAIAESPKTSAAEKKQQRQNACSTNPCTYNSQSVTRNIVTIVSVRNARARAYPKAANVLFLLLIGVPLENPKVAAAIVAIIVILLFS